MFAFLWLNQRSRRSPLFDSADCCLRIGDQAHELADGRAARTLCQLAKRKPSGETRQGVTQLRLDRRVAGAAEPTRVKGDITNLSAGAGYAHTPPPPHPPPPPPCRLNQPALGPIPPPPHDPHHAASSTHAP